jgi:hypothetical protein
MENKTSADTGKTEIPALFYTLFAWVMIGHFIYTSGRCVLGIPRWNTHRRIGRSF